MKNINKEELHILFEGIKKNNKTSFDTLYEKYKGLVFGVSFIVCKNNDIADEVTQNVFFKIWRLSKEKLPSSYEASWLYTITKNETIDVLRKTFSYVDIDSIYNIESNNADISDIIDIDSYNRKISALDEQEKQIISLKLLSNFTFKEISQLLNIPTATVQWKYYKSLNSLKLSLANLAMFILSFAIYLSTKITANKNKVQSSEKSINSDSIEHSKSSSHSGTTSVGDVSISEGVDQITTSTISTSSGYIHTVIYIAFSFSTIFLTFSIIFAIIFAKNQQKRKNKTSKNYMKK